LPQKTADTLNGWPGTFFVRYFEATAVIMKRSAAWFLVLTLLSAICAGGVYLLKEHAAPAYPSGDFSLRFPRAAFLLPGGDFLVAEDGGRIVRISPDGIVRWTAGRDGLIGDILAVDVDQKGNIYVIDRLARPRPDAVGEQAPRFERVVRLSPEGKPAGVLAQKRFLGQGGFTKGALRAYGDSVWYLFASDDNFVSLARVGLGDSRERVLIKTDWSLSSASIAPGGPDGSLAIATGGGIVRFYQGRFELLSELFDDFPYPSELRYLEDGSLVAADAYLSALYLIAPDGGIKKLLEPAALAALGKGAGMPIIDTFSMHDGNVVFVEQASSTVISYNTDSGSFRTLPAPRADPERTRLALIAWYCAAAALALALAALILLLSMAVRAAPAFVSLLIGLLPGILALAALLGYFAYRDAQSDASSRDAALLEALRDGAEAAAANFDAALLPDTLRPGAFDAEARGRLAGYLSGLSRSTGLPEGSFAALYGLGSGTLRFIGDESGRPGTGLPQRYALPSYASLFEGGASKYGMVEDPQGSWLAAAASITKQGKVAALLEFSLSPAQRLLAVRPAFSLTRLALALPGLALIFLCPWLFIKAGARYKEKRAALRAKLEAEAEANAESEAAADEEADHHDSERGGVGAGVGGEPAGGGEGGAPHLEAGERPPRAVTRKPAARSDKSVSVRDAHKRAAAALNAGRPELAARILEALVVQRPKDAQAFNNLGIAYKRMGSLAKALACLERAATLDPTNGSTRANLEKIRSLLP
jgi:tetratricopeptide (TPR) repeat protein